MKKKIILGAVVTLLFASLVSCNENKKARLTYGTETPVTLFSMKELTNDELLVKTRDEKEVFLLATYQGEYSEDCLCWSTFQEVIVNYMNYFNRLVYVYNAQSQDDSLKNLKIEKLNQSTPYLYIFNGEEKIASFSYNNKKDKKLFEDRKAETIKATVDRYVEKPLLCYLDPESVEISAKNNKNGFLVAFIRQGCGDCKYVLPNVIIPYINSHKLDVGIRIVDLQKLYDIQNNPETSGMPYDGMKDRCQLSEEGNVTFGYGKGVVPTIQYYSQGKLSDASVYFNDEISKKEDGSYYISNSYYSEERLTSLKYLDNVETKVLKGMSLSKEDVVETDKGYMFWSQEKAASYHTPLLISFLDTYCR